MSDQLYKCPECGWVGTERDMDADYMTWYDDNGIWDGEDWSDWICPQCHMWQQLEDYEKVDPAPVDIPSETVYNAPHTVTNQGKQMSSNSESYKKAIDILMDGTFNARDIAVELAKSYPTIFIRLATGITNKVEPWMVEVHDRMVSGAKVEAIKAIRTATGLGLKEAKDISDNLQNLMTTRYAKVSYYDGAARLSDAHQALVQSILKAR